MGIEERDAARAMFPPLDAMAAAAALAGTRDVVVDAAATIRGYLYAAPDAKAAYAMALRFGTYLAGLFPGPRTFHLLLEGDVPPQKTYERGLRSAARAAAAARKGTPLDAPVAQMPGLHPSVLAAADAVAGADVPRDAVTLRQALRQYARGDLAELAAEAGEMADDAVRREVVHLLLPRLEEVARARAVALAGDATCVIGACDDMPPEGEARALPYARALGRPCVFVGNDTDIFVIALLTVPRFADHPPVYYYDIARTRVNAKAKMGPHVVDLVACARAVPAGTHRSRALTLLLCGNDYVPPPDVTHMTLHKLSAKRRRCATESHVPIYEAAYAVVAAAPDADALAGLVSLRFSAKAAYTAAHVAPYVRRALVAVEYYGAATRAEVPAQDVWLAHGWRSATEPERV